MSGSDETKEQSELEPIGGALFEPLADDELEQVSGGGIAPDEGHGTFGPSTTEIGQPASFDSDRID